MKKQLMRRLLCLALVIVLCLSVALPAGAVTTDKGTKFSITKVDNSEVSGSMDREEYVPVDEPSYQADEMVRVSIVLEEKSTIAKMGTTIGLAQSSAAVQYRQTLQSKQNAVVQSIENKLSSKLDVVWNLTLAANIISANVKFGQIEAIEKIPGVKSVLIETQYEPCVVDQEEVADPQMTTSSAQIGSSTAWAAGYTGAGSKIAIIDTGLDLEHISMDAAAFDYAIEQTGKTVDLLTADEVAAVTGLNGAPIYYNSKVPVIYNYVDRNTNVTHMQDTQSEHGSHVAGISAANRFINNGDGTFSDAATTVLVQGVAPDAQLMVMKVFGAGGGAYDSDYMAAIEDAVLLGADSINLSLGSGNPGTSACDETYKALMDSLTECGAVVAMSAGNSGHWAESTTNGYLYSDDVSMQTNGSPGSYTNSLSVASVDNSGYTGAYVMINDTLFSYSDNTATYNLPSLTTLAGDKEFVYLDSIGVNVDSEDNVTEDHFDAIKDVVAGKIALCNRGTSAFNQKVEAAARAGAAAVIIVNNQSGIINMDLGDYSKTDAPKVPAVSVQLAAKDALIASGEATTTDSFTYYTGTMTISDGIAAIPGETYYYTMSSFSSWGVPGSLEMKPEITAPGGNIYSLNGAHMGTSALDTVTDHDVYESLSGTSMASPQVAGMAAVVAQYIRENDLDEKTGLSARVLAQSLLMSTAEPIIGGDSDYYYPILQQGAGLANVGAAVTADTYILMDESATASYADGKVKAELGDDPEKTGKYTVKFSINSLVDSPRSVEVFTEVFVNGITQDSYGDVYMYPTTIYMGAIEDNVYDLAAGGKQDVTVDIDLNELFGADALSQLNALYPNGFYVQAYIYAASADLSGEFSLGAVHSIPVLGFYGDWSDPSMFDKGSYVAYNHGLEERLPYLFMNAYQSGNEAASLYGNSVLVEYANEPGSVYYFGGNPLVYDDTYMPERNAINGNDALAQFGFVAIRNAANSRYLLTRNGTEVLDGQELGPVDSAYYYVNGGVWQNTGYSLALDTTPASLGAKEGDQLELSLTLAPEYYGYGEDTRWDELGKGATLSMPMVVDNTAPVVDEESLVVTDTTLSVNASDNNYIAAVVLYDSSSINVASFAGAKQEIEKGAEAAYELDITGVNGKKFYLQVSDYAMNTVTYVIEQQIGEELPLPEMMAFDIYSPDRNSKNVDNWVALANTGDAYTFASYYPGMKAFLSATIADHMLFAMDEDGVLYVMPEDDLGDMRKVSEIGLPVEDMAYNAEDGKLYGVVRYDETTTLIVAIDKLTGAAELAGVLPFESNTLACDKNGVFYSNYYLTGAVYKYTLEGLQTLFGTDYDFTADELVNLDDGQALLDFDSGLINELLSNAENADLDFDEDIDSHDAYRFYTMLANGDLDMYGLGLLTEIEGLETYYSQAMEIDPNTGLLYWASQGYDDSAVLYEIDTKSGDTKAYNDLLDQLVALVIPEREGEVGSWADPSTEPTSVTVMPESLNLVRGSSGTLTASVAPWTLENREVTWSSSDTSVATVDANGVVTGTGAGTATITAASVLDPTVTGTCEVTVEVLDITLKGALQDEDGDPMTFTWNMATEDTWSKDKDMDNTMISATSNDNGLLYVINESASSIYSVDLATGATVETWANASGLPFGDLSISPMYTILNETDYLNAVYYTYMFPEQNPAATTPSGYNLATLLAPAGASELVAIYSAGIVDLGSYGYAELSFLLDDAGNVWEWYMPLNGGAVYGGPYASNLVDIGYEMVYDSNDNVLTSMVYGYDDGCLYVSAFDGETSKLYRLSPVLDSQGYTDSYEAVCFGDVGQDVWPAILYEVTSNAAAGTDSIDVDADKLAGLIAAGNVMERTEFSRGELAMAARQRADKMATEKSNTVAPQSDAGSSADDSEVLLRLTAQDAEGVDVATTNGRLVVTFDPNLLTLVDGNVFADHFSANLTEERSGKIVISYADLDGIAAGEYVAELLFERLTTGVPTFTVSTELYNNVEPGNNEGVDTEFPEEHVHTPEDERRNVVEPGVGVPGYTGDLHCANCGQIIEEGEVIPALEPELPFVGGMIPIIANELPFVDVYARDWFYSDVEFVWQNGLMNGVGGDQFAPNASLTRAMVVTILHRMEGAPVQGYAGVFGDVTSGQWYTQSVEWAAANGIVNGYANGNFGPNDPITREQLAAILYRYANWKGIDVSGRADLNGFADYNKVSNYAKDAMSWAVFSGLINGSGNKLDPTGTATRAQTAAILRRLCENVLG